jgi:hypothetical protein
LKTDRCCCHCHCCCCHRHRRVPQPHPHHDRFSFAAPAELTSVQVNLPTYQLPELPPPDRPLPKPLQQAPTAVPLVKVSCLLDRKCAATMISASTHSGVGREFLPQNLTVHKSFCVMVTMNHLRHPHMHQQKHGRSCRLPRMLFLDNDLQPGKVTGAQPPSCISLHQPLQMQSAASVIVLQRSVLQDQWCGLWL